MKAIRTWVIAIALLGAALLLASCGPKGPLVEANDQEMRDDAVVVARVLVDQPAWVVIHADLNGAPTTIIGQTRVEKGDWENVPVNIDIEQATPVLHAGLYADAGESGVFEYGAGDGVLVDKDGQHAIASFRATFLLTPRIVVSDQAPVDNSFTFDEVEAAEPGWLAIHADVSGTPGPVFGYAYVEPGITQGQVVELEMMPPPPKVWAVLHVDDGEERLFEPDGADEVVQYEGAAVAMPFNVLAP
jgi:hypothetical protein